MRAPAAAEKIMPVRRYAIVDVLLGLMMIGSVGLIASGVWFGYFTSADPCPKGLPCNFDKLYHFTAGPAIEAGVAVILIGIGLRMLWNVWRRQN